MVGFLEVGMVGKVVMVLMVIYVWDGCDALNWL